MNRVQVDLAGEPSSAASHSSSPSSKTTLRLLRRQWALLLPSLAGECSVYSRIDASLSHDSIFSDTTGQIRLYAYFLCHGRAGEIEGRKDRRVPSLNTRGGASPRIGQLHFAQPHSARPSDGDALAFWRDNHSRIRTGSVDRPGKGRRMVTRNGQPAEHTVPGFAGRLTRGELDAYNAAFKAIRSDFAEL